MLGILDVIEVVGTGSFASVLAVIVTLGKNKTCKTLEDVLGWASIQYISSLDNL